MGRRRPLHQGRARVRQSRRRHLFPLRQPRDPSGGRLRRQHHLQAALQRRDRDDRRPACRRRFVAAADHLPASLGRHPQHLSRLGEPRRLSGVRHRARRQDRASRRPRRGPEDLPHAEGHFGDRVRADLRRRKAPPPQARPDGRPGAPRHDQSGGLRRLRRLLGAVELHLGRAARNRDGPQAHHQPVDLQQGLFLHQGLLPVLRHHRRRQAAPPCAG